MPKTTKPPYIPPKPLTPQPVEAAPVINPKSEIKIPQSKVPQQILDLMLKEKKTLLKWRIQNGKYVVHATTLQKWVIPIDAPA